MVLCGFTGAINPRERVLLPMAALVLGFGLALAAGTSLAQPSPSLEALTQGLIALNHRYQAAGATEQAQIESDVLATAAARQQVLASLIESDPVEVLRVAVPAALRASLPPAVQAYVEEELEIEGVLDFLIEDWPTGARNLYFLEAADRRYSLHFATRPPRDLRTGARIRVKGIRVEGALASDSTSVQTVTPAPVPNTLGEQRTLVLLVNFQDDPTQPWTLDAAREVMFTDTSSFFFENSYQQTWLTGDVVGWYTIPLGSTVCVASEIASMANAAATAVGVNLSAYTRYVYAFPRNSGCGWSGLAQVGAHPSKAWINGSFSLKIAGHELGHNLGLFHAHALECGTTTLGTECQSIEYGDALDIMGNEPAHFNAYNKELLGWLNNGALPPINIVQTSGTYELDAYESIGVNPKALKILKSADLATGQKTWYYVESRQAIGSDSDWWCLGYDNWRNGVIVRIATESDPNSSFYLDMSPGSSIYYDSCDAALVDGQGFSDPDTGVTITTQWANGSSAGVSVSLSQPSCARSNPNVTLSPTQGQWVQAGTPMAYTVSLTNPDNAECADSTFDLQATVPGGWTAALGSPTLLVSPGASASTTLTVASPAAATDGFYTVGVTATNSTNATYTASASSTYVIVSSLTVTVSTDQQSYTRGQTVSMTANVSSGGTPVAKASVTFTVTKPNGSVVSGTATSGTNGSAVFKLRLKRQDPVGTYQVRGYAKMSPLSGSGTGTFTVQ